MISTTDKPNDKQEKLKKLKEYHQPVFDKLGLTNPTYIPKLFYRPYGKTELYIAFFASEISKGDDIYTEYTDKDFMIMDPDRKLYRWRFNPHFEEEYEKTEPSATTGHIRYLVPVEELTLMKVDIEPVVEEKPVQTKLDLDAIPDASDDLPMDQMTIRDYAAIHLKKACSKKKWLNDIVTSKK